jgi:hypothetical protein
MVMLLSKGFADLKSVTARRLSQNMMSLWAWTAVSKQYYLYCDQRPVKQSVAQWCSLMPQIMGAQSEYSEQEQQLTVIRRQQEVSL